MYNRNCNYYVECNCTVKACSHRGTEVTLWETAKERKVYCTMCGNTRLVRKYKKRVVCPYANIHPKRVVCPFANKPVVNNDVYIVFL